MRVCFYSIIRCVARAVLSKRFLLSLCLVSALFIMDLLPSFVSGINVYQGEVYYSYDLISLYMLNGSTMFLGFTFIVTIIPYAGAFCDDYNSGFLIPFMGRTTGMGYAVGTASACGVSAFLCTFLGQVICLLFYNIFIPLNNHSQYTYSDYSLVEAGRYILFLLCFIVLYSLRAAFFALVSLLVSTFVKNKYIIFSIPLIMYFLLMKFGYGVLNLPGYLNVLGIYFGFTFGEDNEVISVLYAMSFTVFTGIIAGSVLLRKVGRCL